MKTTVDLNTTQRRDIIALGSELVLAGDYYRAKHGPQWIVVHSDGSVVTPAEIQDVMKKHVTWVRGSRTAVRVPDIIGRCVLADWEMVAKLPALPAKGGRS